MLQSVQMIVDISLNEISINYIESTEIQFGLFYSQVEEVILEECLLFYNELQEVLYPKDFAEISWIYFSQIKSVFPKRTQRKLHELMFSCQINYWERVINRVYDEFIQSGLHWKSTSESKGTFSDQLMNSIFGNHESKRIAMWIKRLVIASKNKYEYDEYIEESSGSQFDLSHEETKDLQSQYKVSDFVKRNSQIHADSKELISLFYVHLMSVNNEIVSLLNTCHNTWVIINEEYNTMDEQIQSDNLLRRIPEHLNDEDKKKFELIRQTSSLKNEDFYRQYLETGSINLIKKESSEVEINKMKLPSEFDKNMFVGK